MTKRKILHIGTSGVPVLTDKGGALQRRQIEMARRQAEEGHSVTVVSPGDRDKTVDYHGVRIEFLKLGTRRPLRDYEFLVRSQCRLRDRPRFDVMHAHGAPDAARFIGRRLARCSVQSVDFFAYRAARSSLGHRYYTSSLNCYDAILPVSEYCSAQLRQFYPGLTVRIRPLPNGVDLEQFRPDGESGRRARATLGAGSSKLVVYLGRVCEQKGSDLLAHLARSLEDHHPGALVVAAGPPEQFGREETTSLISELRSAGVVCTGAVPEGMLRGLLNAADVFVLPTRRDEMFGMAALEAAACGTPVVASDLGGIPEAVGSGGRLFPVGDVERLTENVGQILSDSSVASTLGKQAFAHAQAYSWELIAKDAERIYEEVLNAQA